MVGISPSATAFRNPKSPDRTSACAIRSLPRNFKTSSNTSALAAISRDMLRSAYRVRPPAAIRTRAPKAHANRSAYTNAIRVPNEPGRQFRRCSLCRSGMPVIGAAEAPRRGYSAQRPAPYRDRLHSCWPWPPDAICAPRRLRSAVHPGRHALRDPFWRHRAYRPP